ncbi:MAG: hypothetical protein ACTSRS_02925 [Candidatus Helarchaeota archaeon]
MADLFEKERDLILQEYSCDFKEERPAEMIIYISITPEIHYQIQINFEQYPKKPTLHLPAELEKQIGDPNHFLPSLRHWNPQKPPHVIETIRELETHLFEIISPDKEMEQVMLEFNAYLVAPFRIHVILVSYKMNTYEFDIVYKKPNPPSLIFDSRLEKILKIDELSTLSQWPRANLADICREISKKINHRSRILDELKSLEENPRYRKIIKHWNSKKLILEIQIEIETGESCAIEFNFSEDFPLAPPNMEIKTIDNEKIREALNDLLLSFYNQWQHTTTILEILNEIQLLLKQNSTFICQLCHKYECPICHKPLSQSKITGISGELNCKYQCSSCSTLFHKCCWNEYVKFTRKCPKCYSPQGTLF